MKGQHSAAVREEINRKREKMKFKLRKSDIIILSNITVKFQDQRYNISSIRTGDTVITKLCTVGI